MENNRVTKIAVLGAGAMGSVFGGRLAFAGNDVTLLDINEDHLRAIHEHGLRLELDEGERRIAVPAMRPEAFRGPADLIILFTKTFQTDAALAMFAQHLGSVPILCLQNGLGNLETLEQHLRREHIIIGMTLLAADHSAPGVVSSHGNAVTHFYAADGTDQAIVHTIADRLRAAGIASVVDPHVQTAIWKKAAFNCAFNALSALSEATPGIIGDTPAGRRLVFAIADEATSVANARGVPLNKDDVFALIQSSFTEHARHEPSMLQDRRAGRRTEIESLNGAIARYADELGIDAPTNRLIADLVRLTEVAVTL